MSIVAQTKRIYTQESLDSWSEKLNEPWRKFFAPGELTLGDEVFYNGEVRELEVNEYDAIVHARFDQEETCAFLEWNQGKLTVRCSTQDKLLCRALAVAGILEIEKLLQEVEVGKVDVSPEETKSTSALEKILQARKLGEQKASQKPKNERSIILKFAVKESKGLIFKAFWRNGAGDLVPALKSADYTPGEVDAAEREKLIALASIARKSDFKFASKEGLYSLKDVDQVETFFQTELVKWEERFEVSLEAGLELVFQGAREADIFVELEACGEGTLDFAWAMQVDDTILDPDQALALIRKQDETLLFPKLGLVILPKEKVELLAVWKRWLNLYPDGRIPRYLICSLFGDEAIQVTLGKELDNWRDALFHQPSAVGHIPDFLRPYQRQGVKWLAHLCDSHCHGLLADEMGLGKTIQILSFLEYRNKYALPNLIVCPASVVPVWQNEIQRFFPETPVRVLKSGNDFYKCEERVLWIASYTQLRMHKFLLENTEFGYAVLDEAQLIKNPEAKVSQACMRIRAKHRIILTGTPLENRYLDLWTLFRFLMPGLLGTRRQFEDQFSQQGELALERLRKQIAPFVLRRTKTDVLKELPSKTETDSLCPLSEVQRAEYNRLTKDGVKQLGEDIPKAVRERSLSFLTLLTRLRQTCCDPGLLPWMNPPVEASGKLMVLIEKLAEVVAGGHKVVIFSQFVSLLNRVQLAISTAFPGTPLFQLTGKTIDRAKPVDSFQNQEGSAIILVSLRAGGTGITLHTADYVFLMDPWWNPAVEEQAIDRVHRIGQDKSVFVYRMITAGTIESRIQSLKAEKKSIFSGVMGGMRDISDMRNYFDSLSQLVALLPEDDLRG